MNPYIQYSDKMSLKYRGDVPCKTLRVSVSTSGRKNGSGPNSTINEIRMFGSLGRFIAKSVRGASTKGLYPSDVEKRDRRLYRDVKSGCLDRNDCSSCTTFRVEKSKVYLLLLYNFRPDRCHRSIFCYY